MQVGSMLGQLRLFRRSSQSFLASEMMIFADDVERGTDPDFELEVADAPANLKTCTSSRLYVRTPIPIFGEEVPYNRKQYNSRFVVSVIKKINK